MIKIAYCSKKNWEFVDEIIHGGNPEKIATFDRGKIYCEFENAPKVYEFLLAFRDDNNSRPKEEKVVDLWKLDFQDILAFILKKEESELITDEVLNVLLAMKNHFNFLSKESDGKIKAIENINQLLK